MTSTRAINAAAGVIHACMQQGKTLPASQAYALEAAGLLNSPEHAAEVEKLRARVAELEAAAAAARIEFGVRPTADALDVRLQSTNREFVEEQLARLRGSYPDARLVQFDTRHGAWTDVPVPAPTVEALHASSGAVIETQTEPLVDPNGCGRRGCGIPKREHGRQWTPSAGWHPWSAPTQEQIKERMRRRRSVTELRSLLARQVEDRHDDPVGLHHDYRTPHDLPEVTP